jgi:hypothetical protein
VDQPAGSGARRLPIYARSEGLLAAPFDEQTLKLTAQPVPGVDGVVTTLMGGAHFAVAGGTLAYGSLRGADRRIRVLMPSN